MAIKSITFSWHTKCDLLSRTGKFTMLAVKQIVLFVLFATSALAQSSIYAYDCSKLASPSAGCKSYNEMVIASDKQLLATFKTDTTFVCFRPSEDVFFTLSYAQPSYEEFTRVGSTTEYQPLACSFMSGIKTVCETTFN